MLIKMIPEIGHYALIVALLMSVLMHILVPLSSTILNERQAEIAQNITARILTEGDRKSVV